MHAHAHTCTCIGMHMCPRSLYIRNFTGLAVCLPSGTWFPRTREVSPPKAVSLNMRATSPYSRAAGHYLRCFRGSSHIGCLKASNAIELWCPDRENQEPGPGQHETEPGTAGKVKLHKPRTRVQASDVLRNPDKDTLETKRIP